MQTRLAARTRRIVVILLLPLGCQTGVVVPGFVRGGANRPPQFAQAGITRTPSGLLSLTATVIEPDGDGLTIRYDQLAGPFAVQRSSVLVGGAYGALLDPAGDAVYSFRLTASDGFFDVSQNVSTTLGDPAGDEPPAPAAPAALPALNHRYRVRISGQVLAREGLSSFALDAQLELSPVDAAGVRSNELRVAMRTQPSPALQTAPAGAIVLEASASADPASDAWFILEGPESDVQLTGGVAVDGLDHPASGRFRTADAADDARQIRSALLRLRPAGDRVSGELFISAWPLIAEDLPLLAEYAAQFIGAAER
jgi:hypothetical protein